MSSHLIRKTVASARRAQRGVSLLFSLMSLVVLTLGAVALLRSVDTGLLVLGNLGFKQDALAASSVGTEAAIAWLQSNSAETLKASQSAKGYSAVAITALEPTGPRVGADVATPAVLVDWLANGCQVVPGLNGRKATVCAPSLALPDQGSNKIRYFITRLCAKEGLADAANDCVKPVLVSATGSTTQRGSLNYGANVRFTELSNGTYYRIITRVEGVRGTLSFTETLVHF